MEKKKNAVDSAIHAADIQDADNYLQKGACDTTACECEITWDSACEIAYEIVTRIITEVRNNMGTPSLERIKQLGKQGTIDQDAQYHGAEVVLELDSNPILSKGQFSTIIGLTGARKSWFCDLLASVFLANRPQGKLHCPVNDAKVLFVDTELGENYMSRTMQTIRKMTDNHHQNLIIKSYRAATPLEKLYVTGAHIVYHRPTVAILDGVADFCVSPNDERESATIQQFLMTFAATYNCHIINVIHLSKSNSDSKGLGGGRGHLGSDLNRKAEMEFYLHVDQTDKNYTNISMPKNSRLSPPQMEFSLFVNDQNMPELCDCVHKPISPKRESIQETILQILRESTTNNMTRINLARKLVARVGGQEGTRAKDIDRALTAGVLVKNANGSYSINEK